VGLSGIQEVYNINSNKTVAEKLFIFLFNFFIEKSSKS
jgi:hypothetical protein